MFPMSPEDRLREVMQYQDEQRAQMALERIARAASAKHTTEPSGARNVKSSGSYDLWLAASQLLHSLTETRGVVRRRAR